MTNFKFEIVSALEKIFPNEKPNVFDITQPIYVLNNDRYSLQLSYILNDDTTGTSFQTFKMIIDSNNVKVSTFDVNLMPSNFPVRGNNYDSNYLKTEPGLFPDLLTPFTGEIKPIVNQYKSVWINFNFENCTEGDNYVDINIVPNQKIDQGNGKYIDSCFICNAEKKFRILFKVINKQLGELDLIHTEWFHSDCLADYYNVAVFGEEHFKAIDNFIFFAVNNCGINTILTPIFTPPLDTKKDGSRTTVQLLDIELKNGNYDFNFNKVSKWCRLCKKNGVKYLEIPHFFSQWGALYTPQIFVEVNGINTKLFGWECKANDNSYREFLKALIPQLLIHLNNEGYDKTHILFHISDEPKMDDLESYQIAKNQVMDLLKGCRVIDALSNYDFYEKGLVTNPVVSNNHIQKFLDQKVENLWTYYCVSQGVLVPNRFFSMPSSRNRIMGVLLYYYNIKGFLHWGYNFYNSQYSIKKINPFIITDALNAFPSGDAFLVYPGDNFKPFSSIRNEVQMDAFYDFKALKLLEELKGRDFVIKLIDESVKKQISFTNYPIDENYLLDLRTLINKNIMEFI